jgi:hypothetical protein
MEKKKQVDNLMLEEGYVVANVSRLQFRNATLKIVDLKTATFVFMFHRTGYQFHINGISRLEQYIRSSGFQKTLVLDFSMIEIELPGGTTMSYHEYRNL